MIDTDGNPVGCIECPECGAKIVAQVDEAESSQREHCKRCGRRCTIWFAPSPLWNAVIRGGSIDGDPKHGDMVCATCFMQLAEDEGIATRFRVSAEEVMVPLETVTPSGRVWDEENWLWKQPTTGETPEASLADEPWPYERVPSEVRDLFEAIRPISGNMPDIAEIDALAEEAWPVIARAFRPQASTEQKEER